MSRFAILAAVCILAGTASADVKAPDPVPQRVARAAIVCVGKVKSIEEKTLDLETYPGNGSKQAYQVAVISVTESLLGPTRTVRVAFLPASRKGFAHLNLKPGQEALFFLTKVHGQPTYRIWSYEDVVSKANQEKHFETLVAQAKRCGKLLADPDKGLASKEKEDRFLTAAMLVLRYRTAPMAEPKRRSQESVAAAQSKKILQALAESEWTDRETEFGRLTPRGIFAHLGATEKDGWKPPQDFTKYTATAKQWVTDNTEKFRIQRWVVKPSKDDPEPDK